jgi:thermitase
MRMFAGFTTRCALAAAVLAGALMAPAASSAATTQDHLLVAFRHGVTDPTASQAIAALGGRDLRTIPDIGVRVVSVPAASARGALASLNGNRSVAFAEPDAVAKPQESVPDNPYFPQGSFALAGGAWGWWQTHTTQAWDITQGSPSVVIAILDTGLKAQGLNFGSHLVTGWNVLSGTTDTTSNAGVHGTYVAGVAVQAINDTTGNAGYCPSCDVIPVQVGTDAGANYSDMATGITWAADHGARIENLSWAGTTASSALASAVSYARSKGVVVFAAAGNSNNSTPTYPSATPGVLGVAGVGNAGSKAGDSNYGSWVTLAAPEGNMTSWPTMNGAPGYAPVGGTSLAAPAAAGIAGLILSADPGLTGAQLEQTLESSATPVPFQVADGEIDAMAALRSLGYSDPQAATAPVNGIAPTLLAETNSAYNTAPVIGAPQVGQVLVRGQGAWTGSSPLSLTGLEWDRCNPDGTGCSAVGTASTYTVQSADTGYALRLKVTFTDPNGTTAATSALSQPAVAATVISAPVSTAPPAISGTAQSGQSLTTSAGTWSNAPSSYAYQWSRCDATGANCTAISGATGSSYVLASADVASTIAVTVTATGSGGSTRAGSAPTAVVQAGPQTLTFTGSLTTKTPSEGFTAAVGTGVANASLSYSAAKCGSNLTLVLKSGSTTLASTNGPSVLALSQNVAAGSYTFVVSGSTRCAFTLTIASPSP